MFWGMGLHVLVDNDGLFSFVDISVGGALCC